MAMPYQPWRAALQPASFAGAGFFVETGGISSGRRLAVHEYPKEDTPFAEDMGRKARRWPITAYCIGPGYLAARDALIAACDAEGPATLVTPSLGAVQVHCETCDATETREKGGYCAFQLVFVEAGANPDAAATDDTQSQSTAAAGAAGDATTGAVNNGLAGQGGIGSAATASAHASATVTAVTTPAGAPDGGFSGIPVSYPKTP